ncbi:MAG: protease complex subunit PrcB family protein [Flavobacteriales bacterium]|nr:protease complex subunit PrcB family protein [Flavobacteriales bacterium]
MIQKQFMYVGTILMGFMSLQSCNQPKHLEEKPTQEIVQPTNVMFEKIKEGYLTGNGEEKISEGGVVIRSQEEWDVLAKKMNSVNQTIDEKSFDFERVTVVAYFDKIRGSGGYSVDVSSITETDKTTVVAIKKTPSDGYDIEIMTQPYVIVQIAQTENAIHFQD